MGGLGNYSKGWDETDDYDRGGGGDGNDGGGISQQERLYRFRFFIPTPAGSYKKPNLINPGSPVVKRIMFLDSDPVCLYEHGLYNFNNSYHEMGSFTALCLSRNQIGTEGCPLCSKDGGDSYPYFIGFFPVIDMGQVQYTGGNKIELHHEYWTDKDGEKHYRPFQKVLLGAKRGSQDKPGVLQTIRMKMTQLRDRHGWDSLVGTVWDVTRSGEKSAVVGDQWEFVEKIKEEEIADYLIGHGAEKEYLDLEIPVYTDSHTMEGVFDVDPERYYQKLARLVGWGGESKSGGKSSVQGAGFGGPNNEDIPF